MPQLPYRPGSATHASYDRTRLAVTQSARHRAKCRPNFELLAAIVAQPPAGPPGFVLVPRTYPRRKKSRGAKSLPPIDRPRNLIARCLALRTLVVPNLPASRLFRWKSSTQAISPTSPPEYHTRARIGSLFRMHSHADFVREHFSTRPQDSYSDKPGLSSQDPYFARTTPPQFYPWP